MTLLFRTLFCERTLHFSRVNFMLKKEDMIAKLMWVSDVDCGYAAATAVGTHHTMISQFKGLISARLIRRTNPPTEFHPLFRFVFSGWTLQLQFTGDSVESVYLSVHRFQESIWSADPHYPLNEQSIPPRTRYTDFHYAYLAIFLPRDAIHRARVYATACRPSVRLSACL